MNDGECTPLRAAIADYTRRVHTRQRAEEIYGLHCPRIDTAIVVSVTVVKVDVMVIV